MAYDTGDIIGRPPAPGPGPDVGPDVPAGSTFILRVTGITLLPNALMPLLPRIAIPDVSLGVPTTSGGGMTMDIPVSFIRSVSLPEARDRSKMLVATILGAGAAVAGIEFIGGGGAGNVGQIATNLTQAGKEVTTPGGGPQFGSLLLVLGIVLVITLVGSRR